MNPTMKKSLLASSVALAVGAPAAHASLVTDIYGPYNFSTDRANFTMLSAGVYGPGAGGGIVGGTNDVAMTWDGNGYNASSDYTGPGSGSNVTASSTSPFFGYTWTAHDIQVFTPGSYSFDTTIGGGNGESGTLSATVGTGQLGMHMLFDWAGNYNIDVFVVASPGQVFGSGVGTKVVGSACTYYNLNCLWSGKGYAGGNPANAPNPTAPWMLTSVDGDGDSVMGIGMAAGGPFPGFRANFNANLTSTPDVAAVPVPAAVWLFGSGLLGLAGIARRKKKA